jgi:hypothetical protein
MRRAMWMLAFVLMLKQRIGFASAKATWIWCRWWRSVARL